MSNGPIEPAADIRQMASLLHQTYLALVNEGFTEQQALLIVGQVVSASFGGKHP